MANGDVTDAQMDMKDELEDTKLGQDISIEYTVQRVDSLNADVPTKIEGVSDIVNSTNASIINLEATFNNYTTNYLNRINRLPIIQTAYDNYEHRLWRLTFLLHGTISNFYPIRLKLNGDVLKKFSIYRNKNQETAAFVALGIPSGGVRLNAHTIGNSNSDGNRVFRILNYEEEGSKCIGAIGLDLYGSVSGEDPGYDCNSHAGLYLRGGISYTLETNDRELMNDLQDFLEYAGSTDPWIIGDFIATALTLEEISLLDNDPRLNLNYLEGRGGI